MPMVTVKLIEGVFTAEQKQEMIHKITDTMVEIEGENLRPVTWVLVEEVHSGQWGVGGNGLTTSWRESPGQGEYTLARLRKAAGVEVRGPDPGGAPMTSATNRPHGRGALRTRKPPDSPMTRSCPASRPAGSG